MSNPMGLTIPLPTSTPGPDYAQEVSNDLELVATHDHTNGKGNPVPSDGIDINADLPFEGFSPTDMTATAFRSLASLLASSLLNRFYVVQGDAYFTDGQGRQIRVTQGGQVVNGGAGNITGLVSPASASFNPATGTFTWQKTAGIPAAMDFAQALLRDPGNPANRLAVIVPTTGIPTSYDLALPPVVPSEPRAMLGTPSGGNVALTFNQLPTTAYADGSVTKAKQAAVGQQPVPVASFINNTTIFGVIATFTNFVSTGRPIIIVGAPTNGGAAASVQITRNSSVSQAEFKIDVSGSATTSIGHVAIGNAATGATFVNGVYPPSVVYAFYPAAAGTYTFSLQGRVSTGLNSETLTIQNTTFYAYEM